ncbi:MAG: hypothetical protein KKE16_02655 [Firmicutes bacterium]|nr:hypothetical protein [Bacillota bacterium]
MDEKKINIPPIIKDSSVSVADIQSKSKTIKIAEIQYYSAESDFKAGPTNLKSTDSSPSPYQKNYKNFANKMWNILFDVFGIDEINDLNSNDYSAKQEHHIKALQDIKKGGNGDVIRKELTDPGNLAPVSSEEHKAIHNGDISNNDIESYLDRYNKEYKKVKQARFRRILIATFDFIWSTFIFGFLLTFLYSIIQDLLIEKKKPSLRYFLGLGKQSAIVGLFLLLVSLPFSIAVTIMRLNNMSENSINLWQLLFMALSYIGFTFVDYLRNKKIIINSKKAFKMTVNGIPPMMIFFVGMYLAEYAEKLVFVPLVVCIGLKLLIDNVLRDKLVIFKNTELIG